MENRASTIKQHEPLRAPAGWSAQEKRFVAQLEEILDDLYSRFGRLKDSDLGRTLRNSIARSAEGVSTLTQSAEDFAAAFQDIGTLGEPTGVTRIDKNGLTVSHRDIDCTTRLAADGMKLLDADGNVIGGVLKQGDGVVSAVQCLINPGQDNFRVIVAPDSYEGEQSGLHLIINGEDAGSVSGSSTDAGCAMVIRTDGQLRISAAKSVSIGNEKGSVEISEGGFGRLTFTDYRGVKCSVSFEALYNLLGSD